MSGGLRLPIALQIVEAASTLLAGLGLGAVYEVLGTLRRHCGRVPGAMLDVCFCLLAAWTVFLLGMGPGDGELRGYMPLLAFAGAAVWVYLFGAATRRAAEYLLRLARRWADFLLRPAQKILLRLKKSGKNLKNIFSRLNKRFTINSNHATVTHCGKKSEQRNGVTAVEAEAFQYIYEDCDFGTAGVRRDQRGQHKRTDRTGGGRSRHASGKGGRSPSGKRRAGV